MNKPTPILLAVRLALYGAAASPALLATAAAPALLAAGAGIAHGRVAEPITRCQQGQEVAACAGQSTDAHELHLHELTGLPEPQVVSPPPGNLGLQGYAPTITQTNLPPAAATGTPLPLLVTSAAPSV